MLDLAFFPPRGEKMLVFGAAAPDTPSMGREDPMDESHVYAETMRVTARLLAFDDDGSRNAIGNFLISFAQRLETGEIKILSGIPSLNVLREWSSTLLDWISIYKKGKSLALSLK